MKKDKKNKYSIDILNYRKKQNFYLTIIFSIFTVGFLIVGFILLSINQNGYALGAFLVSVIYGLPMFYTLYDYVKFKRLIKKILDSLSEEEKNDVSFLMSIDCRDYLKKKNKSYEDDEDINK